VPETALALYHVIAWALATDRKPAANAFTAGPERQAAYWIEWCESQFGKRAKLYKFLYRLLPEEGGF